MTESYLENDFKNNFPCNPPSGVMHKHWVLWADICPLEPFIAPVLGALDLPDQRGF